MSANYFPERGEIIWIDFDPQLGHEQAGHRPAFVISPGIYNSKVGLVLLAPVTSQAKGYPFEVAIPKGHKASGVILCDQIKSFDWNARNAKFCCTLPQETVLEVFNKIRALILHDLA
jgi:mRNA interferase MazF